MISFLSRGGSVNTGNCFLTKASSISVASFNQSIDHSKSGVKSLHAPGYPLDPCTNASVLRKGIKEPTIYGLDQVVSVSTTNQNGSFYDDSKGRKSAKKSISSLAVGSFGLTKVHPIGALLPNSPNIRFFMTSSVFNDSSYTDLKVPDLSAYRRESTKDPKRSSFQSLDERRAFTYMIYSMGVSAAVLAGKGTATSLISTWSASKDVLALAKIEVDLNSIPAGKNVVLKWRGKPLFVKHRTDEEIQREQLVDISSLRDPQKDEERVQKKEWLVLLGVCTHLGCVPIAGQGDYNGYYCPCHGSHYDGSGRIRKGPAPANLEVPEYSFLDESTLVVG